MTYRPDKIFIDEQALDYSFAQKVLQKYQHLKPTVLNSSDSSKELSLQIDSLTKGKRILHLKYFKGQGFRLCPGYSDDVLCCNYFVLDFIENCPLECSYCILQAFLNKPIITFHVNVEEIVEQMLTDIGKEPERLFRIGTGQHSDSLALEHIFNINPYLVEVFSSLKNATLELKSKTDSVDNLLGLNHNERTVVSWSLNPAQIIKSNELKTASLSQRLAAARKVVDDGYWVGFHFDPIIHYKGWEKGYHETIDQLFTMIPAEKIAWISMGTLRYILELKQITETRFPNTGIFSNEFIPAKDGKMRYIKPLRKKMIGSLSEQIQEKAPKVPLYLCMEKCNLWKAKAGEIPVGADQLEKILGENVKTKT